MTPAFDPIPPLLQGLAETIDAKHPAGEWVLEIDTRAAAERPLVELAEQFLDAFPYARFAKLERYDEQGGVEWSAADGGSLLDMLEPDGYGFEATLDLALFWQADGELRESVLPRAAELLFERQVPLVTLTIWPNLFTDTVQLPQREPGEFPTPRYETLSAEWPIAAARNRERLEQSLREWERLSEGQIVSWSSPRIPEVAKYGFGASVE